MAVNFDFYECMPPPTDALRQYTYRLYERRGEGVIVPRRAVEVADWVPDPKLCHDNAVALQSLNIGYKAVHGWLYFDFGGVFEFVRFLAHSVVEDAEGNLVDITPPILPANVYPFIRANLTEAEFGLVMAELIAAYSFTNLDLVLPIAA